MTNPTTKNPAATGERVTMTSTPTPDFLTLRAEWKAAGRPAPESGHPYWDFQIPEPQPERCLTGLVPDEAVAAVAEMAPDFRAQSDANIAAMMRRGR